MVNFFHHRVNGFQSTRCTLVTFGVTLFVALLSAAPANAQQPTPQQLAAQQQAAQQQAIGAAAAQQAAPQRPFPPLNPQEAQLREQVLQSWQAKSQATKTLDLKFERWHYDSLAAPAGVHAHKAEGVVKYANPDRGLFLVNSIMFYSGMKDGNPQFAPVPNRFGEYWVCNGVELVEYDREKKKCTVQELPPEMQGKQIFNSPLPFVFNLDAQKIMNRYWVRVKQVPKSQSFLIEAYPKTQQDRAQYKMVQVVLNQGFEPAALIMYAPNYHPKLAAKWDHYEFKDVKRNGITDGFQNFMKVFIPRKPPQGWEVVRENFVPPAIAGGQPQPPKR